jgi:hypothetical protein
MSKCTWMGFLGTTNATTIANFGHIAAKFQPTEKNKITAN